MIKGDILTMSKQELGKKVVELRKSQKMTQDELAKISGVSLSAIRKIEWGDGNPTVDTCEKLCKVFNITIEELLYSESSKLVPELEVLMKQINAMPKNEQDIIQEVIESFVLKSQINKLNKIKKEK